MKQTAVEWFSEQIECISVQLLDGFISFTEFMEQFEKLSKQAKQMEKEQMEISVDEIEKAAKQFYEENIDCSNIPKDHYEWEIQELMSDFCYKWYREQLKQSKR